MRVIYESHSRRCGVDDTKHTNLLGRPGAVRQKRSCGISDAKTATAPSQDEEHRAQSVFTIFAMRHTPHVKNFRSFKTHLLCWWYGLALLVK
jgi:hypothetical protein